MNSAFIGGNVGRSSFSMFLEDQLYEPASLVIRRAASAWSWFRRVWAARASFGVGPVSALSCPGASLVFATVAWESISMPPGLRSKYSVRVACVALEWGGIDDLTSARVSAALFIHTPAAALNSPSRIVAFATRSPQSRKASPPSPSQATVPMWVLSSVPMRSIVAAASTSFLPRSLVFAGCAFSIMDRIC